MTLNLNGNTLDLSSTTYSVNIKSGGSLTIEDTSGGSISTTGSSHMLYCSSDSSLTINGGTVEFSSTSGTARSAVYLLSSSAFEMNGGEIVLKDGASGSRALYANGEVVINGGAITSTTEGTYAIYPGTKPILTIAGGDINGKVDLSKGEVTINGGMFSSVPSLDNVKVGDGHYAVVGALLVHGADDPSGIHTGQQVVVPPPHLSGEIPCGLFGIGAGYAHVGYGDRHMRLHLGCCK